MDRSNNHILNRIFVGNTFKELLKKQINKIYFTFVKRFLIDPEGKTNQEIISEIYEVIRDQYRNEYFYKNTILNILLLNQHDLKKTTAISEIPIAKSKADFILINGKAVVYEIKTELDNFDRLDSQLNDYYKAFNKVCVVTSESNYTIVSKKLENTPVGIYLLTNKTQLKIKKKPIEDNSKLNLSTMFKILRKSEFESIIKDNYVNLPQVTQFQYYRACQKLFCELPIDIAYKFLLRELKKRNKIDIVEFLRVPYELKFLIYNSQFNKTEYLQLNCFLNNKFGG